MSNTIDQRIVQMTFDNKQFEEGIKESLQSLQKFEASLDLDDLEKKFDLSGLSNSIKHVSSLFDPLAGAAERAFIRMADSAMNAGLKMIKSLSVDNVTAGWQKFGEKTTSVGTLIAQGYGLDEVEEQLKRLNWYTDETSYNFTDMVNNIGKFTASGKKLDESVTAMEGIANWAALSGQNAATASRAMYQISQAMGAGYFRLEDYKSIQNASMDTAEFRQKALDAAVALKTLEKNADGTYTAILNGSNKAETFTKEQFTSGLTEGKWFTSDVMMRVFNDYAKAVGQIYEYTEENDVTASEAISVMGDAVDGFGLKAFKAAQEARTFADVIDSVKDAVSTGFMNTFTLLIGNYEQATKFYTDMANSLYDVFAEPINSLNEFIESVFSGDNGKRVEFLQILANLGNSLVSIWDLLKESVLDVWEHNQFVPITIEQAKQLIDRVKELTEKLVLEDDFLRERLEKTLAGIFGVIHIGWSLLKRVGNYTIKLFKKIQPLLDIFLSFTASVGDFFRILDNSISTIGLWNTLFDGNRRIIKYVQIAYDNFKKSIAKIFVDKPEILQFFSKIENGLQKFVDFLSPITNAIYDRVSSIDIDFGSILSNIQNKIQTFLTYISGIHTNVNGVDLSPLTIFINEITVIRDNISRLISEQIDLSLIFPIIPTVLPSITNISDWLTSIRVNIIDKLSEMKRIITSTDWSTFLINLFNQLGEVATVVITNVTPIIQKALALYTTAMGVLFVYQTYNLYKAIIGLINNLSGLFGLSAIFNSIASNLKALAGYLNALKAQEIAAAVLSFAAAITIIGGSLYLMSKYIDWNSSDTKASITFIAVTLGSLLFLAKTMTKFEAGKLQGAASAFLGFSAAVAIMAVTFKKLTDFFHDYTGQADDMAMAITALAGMIISLGLVSGILSHLAPQFIKGASGMIFLVLALWLMVKPLKSLSNWVLEMTSAGYSITDISGVLGLLAEMILELASFAAIVGLTAPKLSQSIGQAAVITVGINAIIKLMNAVIAIPNDKMDILKDVMSMITTFVISVGGIIAALGLISKLGDIDLKPITDGLKNVIGSLTIFMTLMGVFTVLLSALADRVGIDTVVKTSLLLIGGVLVTAITTALIFTGLAKVLVSLASVGAKLTKVIPVLWTLAGCLSIMGMVYGLLTTFTGFLDLGGTAIVMGATMEVLVLVFKQMLDTVGRRSTSIKNALIAFGSMSAFLLIIGAAFKIMSGINWSNAWVSIVAMGVSMAGIALALEHVAKLSPQQILKATEGIGLVSLSLIAIAGAFKIMESIDWSNAWPSILAMGIAITVISAALVVISKFAPNAIMAAGAIAVVALSISGSLLLIGAAMWLFSEACQNFAEDDSLEKTSKAIVNWADTIIQNAPKIALAIGIVFAEIVTAVAAAWASVIDVVGALIVTTIERCLVWLYEGIIVIMKFFDEHTYEFTELAGSIITAFLQGLAAHADEMAQAASDVIIQFANGLGAKSEELVNAAGDLVTNMLEAIDTKLGDEEYQEKLGTAIGDYIYNSIDFMVGLLKNAGSEIAQKMGFTVQSGGEEIGKNLVKGMITGMALMIDPVGTMSSGLAEKCLEAIRTVFNEHSPSKETEQDGANFGQGLINGISTMVEPAQKATNVLAQNCLDELRNVWDEHSAAKETKEDGKNFGLGLTEGIGSMNDLAHQTSSNIAKNSLNGLRNALGTHNGTPSTETKKDGKNFGQGLIDGIKSMIAPVQNAVNDLISGLTGSKSSVYGPVQEYTGTLGEQILNNVKAYNKSKAAKQSGQNIVQDFIDGVKDKAKPLTDTLNGLGQDAKNDIQNAVDDVTSQLGDKAEVQVDSGIDTSDLTDTTETTQSNINDILNSLDATPVDKFTYSIDNLNNSMTEFNHNSVNFTGAVTGMSKLTSELTRKQIDFTAMQSVTSGLIGINKAVVNSRAFNIRDTYKNMLGGYTAWQKNGEHSKSTTRYTYDFYDTLKDNIKDAMAEDATLVEYLQTLNADDWSKIYSAFETRTDRIGHNTKAVQSYTEEIVNLLKETAAARSELDEKIDEVISPVLTAENSKSYINSLKRIPFVPSTSVINVVTALQDRTSGENNIIDYSENFKTLNGSITSLSNEVTSLKDIINNMQVVLDSDTLVGGIARKMDKTLGSILSQKQRRV